MSDEPESGDAESRDVPIVVTGGSVYLAYFEDEFQDDGQNKGRKRLKTRDSNRKIREIVIKVGGLEVGRHKVPANSSFEASFRYKERSSS